MSYKLLVVMPAYNSQETIAGAIESILNQSYQDLHLCIVDDCSTDNTLKIAKHYAKIDGRVSVYKNKKNMGAYYSRNVGLYVFRDMPWKFFTTHDADDISYKDRYKNLTKVLKHNTNGVQDMFARKELASGRVISEKLTMAHAVFTRNAFESIGYFEETRFGADWEYWARLKQFNKLNGMVVADYKKVLGESFVHSNNLTVQIPTTSIERKNYITATLKKLKIAKDKLYLECGYLKEITKKVA